jgi:hypothetical protein
MILRIYPDGDTIYVIFSAMNVLFIEFEFEYGLISVRKQPEPAKLSIRSRYFDQKVRGLISDGIHLNF